MGVKHSFSSAVSEGADPTLVGPNEWNADHVITGSITGDIGVSSLLRRPIAVNAEDDMFDAASLNGKWLAYTGNDLSTYDLTSFPGWLVTTSSGAKLQAVPAGDWIIETEVLLTDYLSAAYQNSGLVLSSGTTFSTSNFMPWGAGGDNAAGELRLIIDYYINGSYNSSPLNVVALKQLSNHIWFRISKSSTTYGFDYSFNGFTWIRAYTTSSLGFTPTHFGFQGFTTAKFNYFVRYSSSPTYGPAFAGVSPTFKYPLDTYTLDPTYGDDFTGSSLNTTLWTRRNYTSGAETYQIGKNQSYTRFSTSGRSIGDGYFQTAPAGDWTFAMKQTHWFTTLGGFGLVVVDTNGTGIGAILYSNPYGPIMIDITTYSTYGGHSSNPNNSGSSVWSNSVDQSLDHSYWVYLRKSGTSYYMAYSLDGEEWSPESPGQTWSGTVNRVGFMHAPLQTVGGTIDMDWFNKIA